VQPDLQVRSNFKNIDFQTFQRGGFKAVIVVFDMEFLESKLHLRNWTLERTFWWTTLSGDPMPGKNKRAENRGKLATFMQGCTTTQVFFHMHNVHF
jgi:hypothetical protein